MLKNLLQEICIAIQKRQLLHFYYESGSSGKKEFRTVRPYLLGINKKGNLEFAGVPVEELSKVIPDKRTSGHYLPATIDITKFETLAETFNDPGAPRRRVVDTPSMRAIICRYIYDDEDLKRVMQSWMPLNEALKNK